MGCPSASRARSMKASLRRARRSALVPTTRTLSGRMSRNRWPNLSRQASARADDVLVEPAIGLEPGTESHHFAQAIEDHQLAVRVTRDHHVKTVGAEIDCGENVRDGLRCAPRHVSVVGSG